MTEAVTRAAVATEALAVALEIANEWWRDRALRSLVPLLSANQVPVVVAAARDLPTPGTRARSLARLAAALPTGQREALAQAALALAAALPPLAQAGVTALVVGSLPAAQQAEAAREALPTAAHNPDPWERAWTVSGLAGYLPEAERMGVLAVIRGISEPGARVDGLAGLARHLPEPAQATALDEAVSLAHTLEPAEGRARALATLSGALPPDHAQTVAQAALTAAVISHDDSLWARVLLWAGARLGDEAREAALARAVGLAAPAARAEALAALASQMPPPLKAQAAAAALASLPEIEDTWVRSAMLERLAPHLDPAAQPAALALAASLDDAWARAEALSALAAHLPSGQQGAAFAAALAAARANTNPWPRARALTTVAEYLPG